MLNSEGTIKIKIRGQFSKFCLSKQLFAFKEFLMERYIQNYKCHEAHQEHTGKLLHLNRRR